MKRAELDYYLLPVILDEDIAHLYLSANDVAAIIAQVMRDPMAGDLLANGRMRAEWRDVAVEYRLHLGDGLVTIYFCRFKRRPRAPSKLRDLAPAAGRLVEAVIRDKVRRLLDTGD